MFCIWPCGSPATVCRSQVKRVAMDIIVDLPTFCSIFRTKRRHTAATARMPPRVESRCPPRLRVITKIDFSLVPPSTAALRNFCCNPTFYLPYPPVKDGLAALQREVKSRRCTLFLVGIPRNSDRKNPTVRSVPIIY